MPEGGAGRRTAAAAGAGRGVRFGTALLLLLVGFPHPLAAHGEVPSGPADLWAHWNLDPVIVGGLVIGGWLYARGLRRLWRRSGEGRVVSRVRAGAFAGGMAALVIAVVSPLDPTAEVLFSVHMIQHLLLVLVAAPLLVIGAPDVAVLWGLSERWRGEVGRRWNRLVQGTERVVGGQNGVALASVLIAAATLWAWHVPDLYDTAVRRDGVHAAEHLTFLLTALFFWASVLRLRPRDHLGNGLRVVLVFFMAMQGSILGALITFAQRPLYESHAAIPAAWGIAPLADQQLAGLIMWVPPALLYIGVAAFLFVRWLEAVGRRTREREARVMAGHTGLRQGSEA